MLIIQYDPGEPNELGAINIPARSAIRISHSNYWILMDCTEKTKLARGTTILNPTEARSVLTRAQTLTPDHPLYNQPVPEGPFPAGILPGDVRINTDGSWDFYRAGRWFPYSDCNGERVFTDSTVE